MKKITAPETFVMRQALAQVRLTASYFLRYAGMYPRVVTYDGSFALHKAAHIKAAKRLEERGFLSSFYMKDAFAWYFQLTEDGFKHLETSPKQLVIEDLEARIAEAVKPRKLAMKVAESIDWQELKFFRDLYKDPLFTAQQIEEHYRYSRRNTLENYARDYAELCYTLAAVELLAAEF
jgi:hypothetical protein